MAQANVIAAFVLILCAHTTIVLSQNTSQTPAVASSTAAPKNKEQFRVIYEWNYLDFEWKTKGEREASIANGSYIPKNVLISGINYYSDKFFLTVPRLLSGVPATLVTIPSTPSESAPKLTPYPSWEMNKIGDCNAFQFVQNVEVDKNGILWVLDNGRVGTMTDKPTVYCPPSLVLINLKDSSMVRYPFPESVAPKNSTYLNDLVVDNRDGDYAYITDNSASDPGIIVFSKKDKKSWKIRDSLSMTAVQPASNFRINGTVVTLPVNIDGIALGTPFLNEKRQIDRVVYYCPLASFRLYSLNASVLRNESNSLSPNAVRNMVTDIGSKISQTDGMKMDSEGVLYYGLVGNYTISEWDSKTDFKTQQRTIARDPFFIQWIDRFAFDDKGNTYVVINRLYNFIANRTSTDEVNYRILKSRTGSKSYVYADIPDGPSASGSSNTMSSVAVVLAVGFSRLLFV